MLATVAVYGPVGGHDFINYDDTLYITDNAVVQKGLTLSNLRWAFTNREASNWHPLTWLSHMLDVELFGLAAGGHHGMNLFFHLLNTLLLFLILNRLTTHLWRSAFVAALFALHPLHVESVAWVAERKDLLSTLFGFLTLAAYVRYAEKPAVGSYLLSLLCFALGLMAKPMLVTWPFVLLLLDYWPLNRLHRPLGPGETGREPNGPEDHPRREGKRPEKAAAPVAPMPGRTPWSVPSQVGRLLLEKTPFLILAALSSVLTLWAQQKTIQTLERFPLDTRVVNALVSYASYLGKMLWPQGLAVFYPHPETHPLGLVLTAAAILTAMTAFAVRSYRNRPYLIVGWLWYLGTLIPVIGLVQVGSQAMADRYTYIPLIGPFIMIAWGVPDLFASLRHRERLLGNLAGLSIVACLIVTGVQISHWRNSETLFRHTLGMTKRNPIAQVNLGAALSDRGALQEAIRHFQEAIRLRPNYAMAWYNLGLAYARVQRFPEAIEAFQRALKTEPRDGETWNQLGMAYAKAGRLTDALAAFRKALEITPRDVAALNNLGNAYEETGRISEAVAAYERVLEIDPHHAKAWNNLGVAYGTSGRWPSAADAFRKALRIDPEQAHVWRNLGTALRRSGRPAEAVEAFEKALRLRPEDRRTLIALGLAYRESGQRERETAILERLRAMDPQAAEAFARER